MKRTTIFADRRRTLSLNGQAPAAIGVLQILAGESRRKGLTVEQLLERLVGCGVLFKNPNEQQALSSLLQRLMKLDSSTIAAGDDYKVK